MTKRDFFILIIKLFGLFSVVTSLFTSLPSHFSFALMDIDAFSLIWIGLTAIVVVGLFILLIFKSDKVVDLLRLDKGFEDDSIAFGNLSSIEIVKIGTLTMSLHF